MILKFYEAIWAGFHKSLRERAKELKNSSNELIIMNRNSRIQLLPPCRRKPQNIVRHLNNDFAEIKKEYSSLNSEKETLANQYEGLASNVVL